MKKIIIIIVVSMLLLSCESISPSKEAKKECIADIPNWLLGKWEVYKINIKDNEILDEADYFGEAFFNCEKIEFGFMTITKDTINKDIKQELDDSILHTRYEIGTSESSAVKKKSHKKIFVVLEEILEIDKSTNSNTISYKNYTFIKNRGVRIVVTSSIVNGEEFVEAFLLDALPSN